MPDGWIRQWGDPILREAAAPVRRVDDVLRAQAQRIKRRLLDADGAGLAGPQVGFMQRLFAFRESPEQEIDVLVNPTVIAASSEHATFLEGCLSFRGVLVAVQRPAAIRVQAQTLAGKDVMLDAEGYGASLFQHEIDHLDGILTLDRAEPEERHRAIGLLLDEAQGRSDARRLAA